MISVYILWAVVVIMAGFIGHLMAKTGKYRGEHVHKKDINEYLGRHLLEMLKKTDSSEWYLKNIIKRAIKEYEFSDLYEHAARINKEITDYYGERGEPYIDELVARINRKQIKS